MEASETAGWWLCRGVRGVRGVMGDRGVNGDHGVRGERVATLALGAVEVLLRMEGGGIRIDGGRTREDLV